MSDYIMFIIVFFTVVDCYLQFVVFQAGIVSSVLLISVIGVALNVLQVLVIVKRLRAGTALTMDPFLLSLSTGDLIRCTWCVTTDVIVVCTLH